LFFLYSFLDYGREIIFCLKKFYWVSLRQINKARAKYHLIRQARTNKKIELFLGTNFLD
jgi:hypothetical protein